MGRQVGEKWRSEVHIKYIQFFQLKKIQFHNLCRPQTLCLLITLLGSGAVQLTQLGADLRIDYGASLAALDASWQSSRSLKSVGGRG